jgi:hypothetical protein
MSVVRAREQARLYLGALLRDQGFHSIPLPYLSRNSFSICVMLARAEILGPSGQFSIWPPSYIALFSGSEVTLERIRSVKPEDFRCRDPIDQPLGSVSAAARMSDDYLTSLAQALQGIDRLCEPFASGVPLAEAGVASDAEAVRRSLAHVLEPPLHPYYTAIAWQFFGWLGFGTSGEAQV